MKELNLNGLAIYLNPDEVAENQIHHLGSIKRMQEKMDAVVSFYRMKMEAEESPQIVNAALEMELKRQENQNQDDFLNYILKPMSIHVKADRTT